MGRKMKSIESLNRICATCSFIAVCGYVVLFIGNIICLMIIFIICLMIENTSSKNSEYLLHMWSTNSLYKYYIFFVAVDYLYNAFSSSYIHNYERNTDGQSPNINPPPSVQ